MDLNKSLLQSRLYYIAGTWDYLHESAIRSLTHAHISPLRSIADMKWSEGTPRFTNQQVLAH